jgi:hypothetical protein
VTCLRERRDAAARPVQFCLPDRPLAECAAPACYARVLGPVCLCDPVAPCRWPGARRFCSRAALICANTVSTITAPPRSAKLGRARTSHPDSSYTSREVAVVSDCRARGWRSITDPIRSPNQGGGAATNSPSRRKLARRPRPSGIVDRRCNPRAQDRTVKSVATATIVSFVRPWPRDDPHALDGERACKCR